MNLREDTAFENMSMFHPDEEASTENEFGPLLSDGICIVMEMHTHVGGESKSTLSSES